MPWLSFCTCSACLAAELQLPLLSEADYYALHHVLHVCSSKLGESIRRVPVARYPPHSATGFRQRLWKYSNLQCALVIFSLCLF